MHWQPRCGDLRPIPDCSRNLGLDDDGPDRSERVAVMDRIDNMRHGHGSPKLSGAHMTPPEQGAP